MSLPGLKEELNEEKDILTLINAARIISKKQQYVENVHTCDCAIQDVLHDIELSPLNCVELMKDMKLLKGYLKERRKNKNLLYITNEILAKGIQQAPNITKVRAEENVYYRPRVVEGLAVETLNHDLREKIDKRIETQEKKEPGQILDMNIKAAANKKLKKKSWKKYSNYNTNQKKG